MLLLFTRHFVNTTTTAAAIFLLLHSSNRGGDAVDNILFFPDSSRLCSIYDKMSCDFFFFFYLNTFLTRRSGITFGSFFGNGWFITTAVMFIKIFLVDLDLIWFEQIWCHWRHTAEKMKKINSFDSEPTILKRIFFLKTNFNFLSKKKDVTRLKKNHCSFSLQWIVK